MPYHLDLFAVTSICISLAIIAIRDRSVSPVVRERDEPQWWVELKSRAGRG